MGKITIVIYEKIYIYIFFLSNLFFSNLNATIINDHEIEIFIKENLKLISPETASSINIRILLNENPNAFITKNNELYLTTGLLKYIQSPEGLLGVLAHEVGHLELFHILKRKQSLNEIKSLDQIGTLVSITTAILAKRPELLIEAKLASQINVHNYYSSFTKNQEREADLYSIEKLNNLKISTNGLQNFLILLKQKSYQKGLSKDDFLLATHPYFDERLNTLANYSNNNFNNNLNNNLRNSFFFIKAKLFGFTENDINILENYLKDQYLEYGKSIILSNDGLLLESLKKLNKLIDEITNNSYLLETKADLLFNHGYISQAKEFYKLALLKNTNNIYIKKRLFIIEYDLIEFNDYILVNHFFDKYKELIFYNKTDKNFFLKWSKIFNFLEKNDWLLFINAKIDLMNNEKNDAILKLNKILEISNNKELKNKTKKELIKINHE